MSRRKNPRVLVTGATGMLGASLTPVLRESDLDITSHGCSASADVNCDLTNHQSALQLLNDVIPDLVINLIGLTDVEACEANINHAFLLNVRTVENIASAMAAQDNQAHLIHISTDHLYDGETRSSERDVKISNVYALTKFAGELAARSVPSTILRTNFVGRSKVSTRQSLTDWAVSAISCGQSITGFNDIYFSPLSMITLCKMIDLVSRKTPVGIFNLGSNHGLNKADFLTLFLRQLGLPENKIKRANSSLTKQQSAPRPKNMMMDSSKFEKQTGIELPTLEDEIKLMVKDYA